MEVQLTPDIQAKLDRLYNETGRGREEFICDALAGYFDEVTRVRSMLDSRYDDLKSGRATLISGEEVVAHFREKSAARRP